MNRFLIYIPAAAILTAMGRFQETVVYRDGRLQTHHALYGQAAGIVVCASLAVVLLAIAARERRAAREPIFRLGGQRFWPWVFACRYSGSSRARCTRVTIQTTPKSTSASVDH